MRVYAIGDVHGQIDKLLEVHMLVAQDRETTGDEDAPVVHLGDLCDRGPDSRAVIDFLLGGIGAGAPWLSVRGNHDWMMQEFLSDSGPDDYTVSGWLSPGMGGTETLASYGVTAQGWAGIAALRRAARRTVPAEHRGLLDDMLPFFETDDLILVHAGIRPGVAMARQTQQDLCWIRHEFLDDPRDHGKLVVHGHTPVDVPTHAGNRVNLDTGAAYGGPVTAAVFEGRDCWVLTPDGRVPLRPAT